MWPRQRSGGREWVACTNNLRNVFSYLVIDYDPLLPGALQCCCAFGDKCLIRASSREDVKKTPPQLLQNSDLPSLSAVRVGLMIAAGLIGSLWLF